MLSASKPSSKVNLLPEGLSTLPRTLLRSAQPETLFVLGDNGGFSVAPDTGFTLVFGRYEPDVHVSVGTDDPHVSRRHGDITRQQRRWVLNNTGRLPIRLPGERLVLSGDQAELPSGYTPVFIVAPQQEHLLQVRVSAHAPVSGCADTREVETQDRSPWPLSPRERLVLACLSRRYLLPEPHPQPLAWIQVAAELSYLCPAEPWTARRAAYIVTRVRERLSPEVAGLLEEQVPPPVGNALNHNLIMELLITTTLTKADLMLLDLAP